MQYTPPYPLSLLRAAHRGTAHGDALTIVAVIPEAHRAAHVPRRVSGPVIGIGSLISVHDRDTDRLVEDIRSEWITHATVERGRPG